MPASWQDISRWFDTGKRASATHLIIMCDSFDYEDYPVYVEPGESPWEVYERCKAAEMQRVMEIYDLSFDKDTQMKERRAFHLPDRLTPASSEVRNG